MEDPIGGGVGEEMGGTLGGLASAYLLLMLGLDTSMVGNPEQVNSDTPSLEAQPFGQKLGQEVVDLFLQLIQVLQLTGQFSQDGGSRRCSLKVLGRLVDGNAQGRGKEQEVEQVVHLDMASPILQGELAEELDGKLVHIVGTQTIIKLVTLNMVW
jgi:hypothetical protein